MGYGGRKSNKGRAVEVKCRNSLELSLGRNCRRETESLGVGKNVVEDKDANWIAGRKALRIVM